LHKIVIAVIAAPEILNHTCLPAKAGRKHRAHRPAWAVSPSPSGRGWGGAGRGCFSGCFASYKKKKTLVYEQQGSINSMENKMEGEMN
jgi:hypothetical protein